MVDEQQEARRPGGHPGTEHARPGPAAPGPTAEEQAVSFADALAGRGARARGVRVLVVLVLVVVAAAAVVTLVQAVSGNL